MRRPIYRVGRAVGRTLYRDDELIGMVDTPELARLVVAALNAYDAPLDTKPDTRSKRWREAEARCTASHAAPEDLAIVAEEQAKYDAANNLLPRTPDGRINNCALNNGAPENECQMCLGACPDRAHFA